MPHTASSCAPGDARVPDFTGALNFRDMGGYRARDGRTVRWNRLYRSGTTHAMTSSDLEQIVSRGIRYAYDLRSNTERHHYPNRLNGVAEIEYWFREHDAIPGDLKRLLQQPDVRAENCRAVMMSVYRELPYEFKEAYGELFLRLSKGHLPLVFNCTAGKDRTGVAAALVLTALGIPRHVVAEDYQLTERFYDQSCALIFKDSRAKLFADIDPAIWDPVMRADPAYLDAMFARLSEAHGSVERYLNDELGVDARMIDLIRDQLLENGATDGIG